jgi:tRNA nucleotidyltransferase (CCA-adding enzyme)
MAGSALYTRRMGPDWSGSHPLQLEGVPDAVVCTVDALLAAGHEAFLVGGCVRDLLRGIAPRDFDITTSARPEEILQLFPRAVPIGLRHGTLMIPGPAGPVDVTSYRDGARIEEDLAHRDFTINAMVYEPVRRTLLDPFEGRLDLEKNRLRAVGSATERFAEDPLRALRAARLHAALGLEIDPEVERAMAGAAEALREVARERVRHELGRLLLAPNVGGGLALLHRTRLERSFAPRAAEDAPAVVAALPADLELRLAGWLRGARAVSILRRLRYSRRTVERVELLLRLHPVEIGVAVSRDVSLRRFLRRAGERDVPALLALRRAELRCGSASQSPLAPIALDRVDALEAAIDRVRRDGALALRRHDLAIDGREVMQRLGVGPGPEVGRVLEFLTERVLDDPSCNTPEALRELLEGWLRRHGGGSNA